VEQGVDRDRIKRWRRDGRLRPVHLGVYAVGHAAPSPDGDLMAAVLACGAGTHASHGSAGHSLRMLPERPWRPHVTVPTTAGRTRPGIVIHRVKALHVLDTGHLNGIPMTSPARTLLDLAPSLPPAELTRACHEAWIQHRLTPAVVKACIARNPTKKGARKLLRAIGADATLSKLEDAFLALLTRHELPLPRTNIDHRGDKVDCHWPDRHLAYSWGDVFERGAQTAAELTCQLSSVGVHEEILVS
jgi:hypothetical protein